MDTKEERRRQMYSLEVLPSQVQVAIFSFLDIKDLVALSEVNKSIRTTARSEDAWRQLFFTQFKDFARLFPSITSKTIQPLERTWAALCKELGM